MRNYTAFLLFVFFGSCEEPSKEFETENVQSSRLALNQEPETTLMRLSADQASSIFYDA